MVCTKCLKLNNDNETECKRCGAILKKQNIKIDKDENKIKIKSYKVNKKSFSEYIKDVHDKKSPISTSYSLIVSAIGFCMGLGIGYIYTFII